MKLIFEKDMCPAILAVWRELLDLHKYVCQGTRDREEAYEALGSEDGWGAWILLDKEDSQEDLFSKFSQLGNFANDDCDCTQIDDVKNVEAYIFCDNDDKNGGITSYLVLFQDRIATNNIPEQLMNIGTNMVHGTFECIHKRATNSIITQQRELNK